MEYLNFLVIPIYFILFNIQRRLTKVETKIEMKIGCKDEGSVE